MNISLEGQVAIVTGSGHGMGRAGALLFAEAGATVVVADFRAPEAEETAQAVQQAGGRAIAIPVDVTSTESIADVVGRVIDECGRIDVLWNCVGGIAWRPDGTRPPLSTTAGGLDILDAEPDYWDWQLRLNVTSVYLCCRQVLPHMIEARRGSIISMATAGALDPHEAGDGFHPYIVAKSGVVTLSRLIARKYGPFGIRSNVIAPGIINSWWTPELEATAKRSTALGRIGTVEDVAQAALFLASDASSYITGQEVLLNGGAHVFGSAGSRQPER